MKKRNDTLARPSGGAPAAGPLPAEDLLALLARQMALYAGGDTSLREETAAEIAKSVALALRLARAAGGAAGEDLQALLDRGRALLRREMQRGEALLRAAGQTAPSYANISMRDTLEELGVFFKRYDLRFFAHDAPCLVDYQLCCGTGETEGILYVNDYLSRLLLENEFCARFDPRRAAECLARLRPTWHQEVSNLCEPLIFQALGLTLLEGDIHALCLGEADLEALEARFQAAPWAWGDALAGTAERLGHMLALSGACRAYLSESAQTLAVRSAGAGSVRGCFAPERDWRV